MIVEPFIKCIEDAYHADDNTRTYLVVPERPVNDWFTHLAESLDWNFIGYIPAGQKVFKEPRFGELYKLSRRQAYRRSVVPITIWELNKNKGHYKTIQWAIAKNASSNIMEFLFD